MKNTISLVLVLALGLATEVAKADFTFGTPTNPGPPLNSSSGEGSVCISANGLEFYFVSNRPGGYGDRDLWVMKRPTKEDDWGDPVNVESPVNSQYGFWEPSISSDGLSLYFSDGHAPQFVNRLPGGIGGQGDIWMITRETIHDTWGAPVNIGPLVNKQNAVHPSLSADGLSLYFQSHLSGGGQCDIMVATRESTSDSFGNPTKPAFLRNVNSSVGEWMPDISADGRVLFFNRRQGELWMSRRATIYDNFGPPLKLPQQFNILNSDSPSVSPDGSTLYFSSGRPGGIGNNDIWQVSISPVVDFNSDGIVDSADMRFMVDHWGEDYSLCDIGPMPWGDGIVDVQDLIVLADYLFGDMQSVAHFKLDEAKGSIANDSARNRDGTVHGGPEWRPADGVVGGALLLDGIEDYIRTGFVLNPADGALSVFAWIKGGAPGQVVISQTDGASWLLADPTEGNLMTELKSTSRSGKPLQSQTVITDGNWHRIGFVWDGSNRTLYVDDIAVTQDTQDALAGSVGGLYIGCGKAMEAGTYWSGLIDDIRIYNRVVMP